MKNQALTNRERYDMIEMKSKQFEQKARLDEKLLKLEDTDQEVIEKILAVNDYYIESIKAKLHMLNAN